MKPSLPEGYQARFNHIRIDDSPRGGATFCSVLDADDHVVARGSAFCNAKDNFNKRIGRDIALGRALKKAGLK